MSNYEEDLILKHGSVVNAVDYEQAKMMLILKHGTLMDAFKHWRALSIHEQYTFDKTQYEVLMQFEYDMHYASGLGYGDPR